MLLKGGVATPSTPPLDPPLGVSPSDRAHGHCVEDGTVYYYTPLFRAANPQRMSNNLIPLVEKRRQR